MRQLWNYLDKEVVKVKHEKKIMIANAQKSTGLRTGGSEFLFLIFPGHSAFFC